MNVTFTFTDEANLAALPTERLYHSHFELPDSALQLPDCKARVLTIASSVGQLTQAALHVTCKELDLQNHPIKLDIPEAIQYTLNRSTHVTMIAFGGGSRRRQDLTIYLPVTLPLPPHLLPRRKKQGLANNLYPLEILRVAKTEPEQKYANNLNAIAEQIVVLLNSEPNPYYRWWCGGFHPRWLDKSLITRHNKRTMKEASEERKRQKQEERLKAQHAKLEAQARKQDSDEPPQTGGGRLGGPIPGVFKGVQFRSQLEIRFVTELEERGVRWVYESERIGEGSYLVDFYLLDYRAWVEVKGAFEARDNFLLKEIAKTLKEQRGEKLYVFGQRKCYLVNPSAFKELSRDEFWKRLLTPPKSK